MASSGDIHFGYHSPSSPIQFINPCLAPTLIPPPQIIRLRPIIPNPCVIRMRPSLCGFLPGHLWYLGQVPCIGVCGGDLHQNQSHRLGRVLLLRHQSQQCRGHIFGGCGGLCSGALDWCSLSSVSRQPVCLCQVVAGERGVSSWIQGQLTPLSTSLSTA